MNVTTKATIATIGQYVDQEVLIEGWLWNKRFSGKIGFLNLRDGTGFIQGVIAKQDVPEELFATAKGLTQETSIRVTGTVRAEERAASGYELNVTGVEVVAVTLDYPITPKEHGVDFLMDNRHLWIRSPRQRAILKIRAEIIRGMRDYLDNSGFTQIDPPILTPSSAEGTTNLFEIEYVNGEPAYLSQSGQLYMEAAALALGKVYSFGPTFRAEKSKTRKHMIEFWMIEPEMAYVTHAENMQIQEAFVKHIIRWVLEHCPQELKTLERDTEQLWKVVNEKFPVITYKEAVQILQDKGHDFPYGEDFGAPHETELTNHFDLPVFVEKWPADIKAFYMQPDPDDPTVVLGADLLAPEGYGEIIGGSQRIHDYDLLKSRYEEHELGESYNWYLDLRQYGTVPHSGFGIGLERTIAWICGIDHVRETIMMPRLLYRLYP
ncbi:asparaginyl-tRNA synthetase [Tumebacillus permanentifrigoris]|uniref:Asparagine--tRNA ligase n=1 Tax=Tumebacillus permanentifrigoris TaxID=378543 RepID=A0A316DC76_9BACL|nr:asparagine--tRNA ligase [Tumebacillus permanentifrigoris]PWK15594.1 asparaginyl-tRNA synthetase [Tumebacillus permanentifrigoris]